MSSQPLKIRWRYDANRNALYIIDAETGRCVVSMTPSWDAKPDREPPTPDEFRAVISATMARLRMQFAEVVE